MARRLVGLRDNVCAVPGTRDGRFMRVLVVFLVVRHSDLLGGGVGMCKRRCAKERERRVESAGGDGLLRGAENGRDVF